MSKLRPKLQTSRSTRSRRQPDISSQLVLGTKTTFVSIDTETTGPDFFHGCKPFLLSLATDQEEVHHWEWKVDPYTRVPSVPIKDLISIQNILNNPNYRFVFHNAKFDLRAMESLGLDTPPWENIEDTLIASHVLASSDSHALKDLAIYYLGIPDNDEEDLKKEVQSLRPRAKSLGWDIAHKGHPHFPTLANTEWWKMDMWLPRAFNPESNVCQTYARLDAIRTIGLWSVFFEALEDERLLSQYRERVALIRAVDSMENRGITVSKKTLTHMQSKFTRLREDCSDILVRDGNGYVENPNSPNQLAQALYQHYGLPVLAVGKSGVPSTSKDVLDRIQDEYALEADAKEYLERLTQYRKLKKCVEYLHAYESGAISYEPGYMVLHPEFNITGTRTTRFSSKNPNAQNISKQDGYNLREGFGPIPGREWYSIDYDGQEMRLFAYSSGDQRLIDAFESGKSVHLTFAEILHPREFAWCVKHGVSFKDKYKATLYQNTKNGNFSLIYGASERKADSTYQVKGAYKLIRRHLPRIDSFIRQKYEEGLSTGYVTLLGGYRLQVPRKEPHKACNYFIQGSGGWAIIRAMNRIYKYLQKFPDYYMIMQVHDELVFDFPCHPRNPQVIYRICKLMEKSGEDIDIPLPVEADRITRNWAKGEQVYP